MPNPPLPRRDFVKGAALGAAGAIVSQSALAADDNDKPRQFRLWCMGCSHVGTDKRVAKRESLGEAIRHSEQGGDDGGPAFDWDIALHLGDTSGNQGSPSDEEGQEVVKQFGRATKHRREHFYNIAGNHDASGPGEPTMGWFRKWIDPTGEHTDFSGVDASKRPHPIEGTWERYSFRVGNLLFLMMSDRNDGGPPIGRDKRGGYPAGAVTAETFAWWRTQVEKNSDAVIVSTHHHMLRETTVASGPFEGFQKTPDGGYKSHYHGYFPKGGPKGASYLYFVGGKADAQAFEGYLAEHEGAVDLWLGGHTHAPPDDDRGGRTHIERRWGTNFINVAALSRHHARLTTIPMSRLLTFTEGSPEVNVQCYLHTSQHAPQGWYAPAERTIHLGKPFRAG
ncbi:MAG: metallophosphoesterase [Pirellulaceae bacterium]